MRIDKLNDDIFYDFASEVIGANIRLYQSDFQMIRSEKGVKIRVFLGGENEDQRRFYFQDSKCVFINYSHGTQEKDLSYDWILYMLECADELTEEDKDEIIDEYNTNLEKEIENYANKKRQHLINA